MSRTIRNSLTIDKKLFNSSYDKITELSKLKLDSYRGFQKKIKKAYKHPITKHLLRGQLFPSSYSDIRVSRQNLFSDNLEGELAWIVESIKNDKKKINSFLTYEGKIENLIINGEYTNAQKVLHRINEEICYSYWGLELEYFFKEELEGTEGNWLLKNSINKSCKNSYTIFFNQIFSKRAEKNISILDFSRSFSNGIRNVPQLEFEYLNFKIAYHLLQDYNSYSFITYADNTSSIIDRYFSILNVLTELISCGTESYISLTRNVLKDLEGIDDQRLTRLQEYIGDSILNLEKNKAYSILENYTLGKYEKCLETIPEAIRENPRNIELWDLYLKSLIEINKPYNKLGFSNFVDNLLFDLYRVYLLEDDSKEKAENILKLASTIPNISFSKQIIALVVDRIGIISKKNIFNKLFCIHSEISNPLIVLYSEHAITSSEFENLKTTECIKYISGETVSEDSLRLEIKDFKFKLYSLRRFFDKEEYQKCIDIYNDNEYKSLKNKLYIEEVIYIIYHSLFNLEKHDEAIDLYVDSYFFNENLLNRINSRILIDKIISENYSMTGSLNSAIFFTLENLETYYYFVGIEMWLESIGIELPSEIELDKNSEDFEKNLFLLEYGCSIEVLEKFYYNFENKDEVVSERKKILSKLIQNIPSETDKFIDELSSITQKEKIQLLLKEVNSGRIRLDRDMISAETDNNFEKSYNRYQLLSEFSKNNETSSFDTKKLLKNFLDSLIENQSPSMNPSFLSFKNLVNEMIDTFLFNKKSGLDGELSTRIRHGELENQLRSVFDRKNLISKRDDSNKYTDLKYWNNYYGDVLNENTLKEIQNALKTFSSKIDKIIQFLVKNRYKFILKITL